MAEALLAAGGEVHCLDKLAEPAEEFRAAQARQDESAKQNLQYWQLDVCDTKALDEAMASISGKRKRLDGVIAAAGVNHLGNATDHTEQDIDRVMRINYIGAFHTATAAANYMRLHNSLGSILLVASMSGLIANKGMVSPVYNSSKAAVIQLARSLAMEWGNPDGQMRSPIRVNSLCPGHIATPMAQMVMDKSPETRKVWESENMLGRLAQPCEFAGPAIFLLSDASSFVTGSTVIIDGGHTAW
ncbi:Uncharacterized protein PECH_001609 [Penicillium ucsense]|uniref:Uncharacterized protein n=1 Tax=Penicillium ucsense TaxID=2839758 RepID=A0A8J8WG38_9EURO|nr:Uncharacterized protein PECM_001420 [Penicillium ucsense]KAF7732634.1 Uncharacterized protein PECH_001609 [Penicillium ucsense]